MSGQGTRTAGDAGFTLLEVLLTLAILAVASGAAALALGGALDRDSEAAAQRLTARLQYAADDALVTGRQHAFVPGRKSGYRFLEWNLEKQIWVADTSTEFATDGGADDQLSFAGLGDAGGIRFRSAGNSDAFSLLVVAGDKVWRIVGDGLNVTMVDGLEH